MTQHRIHKYSHIARPMEPAYPTNRNMLIALPIIGIGMAIYAYAGGLGLSPAAFMGLKAIIVGFLSWALAREFAPDAERVAYMAPIMAVMAMLTGDPGLWTAAAALFLVRTVNRSVGPPANLADRSITLSLVALSVLLDGVWAMGVAGALAFSLDASLKNPSPLGWPFAMLSGAISAFAFLQGGGVFDLSPLLGVDTVWMIMAIVIMLCTLWGVLAPREPASVCDINGEPLSRSRVALGLLVGLAVVLAAALLGQAGLYLAIPVWAGLAAAGVGKLLSGRA